MKRIYKIVSMLLIITLITTLSVIIFNPLNKKEKIKNKNEVKYNNVYYASSEESSGASGKSSMVKGGAMYIGKNGNYLVDGAVVDGFKNTYGGAYYVSSGATLTMNSGIIRNCEALYGGAVYVEAGGTFIMNGGTIENNKAQNAPAIYVEDGGHLEIKTGALIQNNELIEPMYEISEDTIRVGRVDSGLDMHYVNFGSYPQTYVGCYDESAVTDNVNLVNTTLIQNLETFASNNTPVKHYNMQYEVSEHPEYGKWEAYKFTDGQVYARGISYRYPNDSNNYQKFYYMNKVNPSDNGPAMPVDGTIVWFKVEPIKWIVMNYDAVMNGTANTIDVLAYNALTAMVQFTTNNSTSSPLNSVWYANDGTREYSNLLRTWLNGEFLSTAFTLGEQNFISMKTNLNNWTDNTTESNYSYSGHRENKSSVTYNGITYSLISHEKVYCLSFEDYLSNPFNNSPWSEGGGRWTPVDYKRLCSPSDFARSNYCWAYGKEGSTYGTADYPNGGACEYWTRSAGYIAGRACSVTYYGHVYADYNVTYKHRGVRPALSLAL